MKNLYPTLFRYSIRVPNCENEFSKYSNQDKHVFGTVRYDTIHRFEVGEIIHIPMDNNLELSFQVCEIIRAFEALHNPLIHKNGGFFQQFTESGHHILLFHVFGKRLSNSEHLLY